MRAAYSSEDNCALTLKLKHTQRRRTTTTKSVVIVSRMFQVVGQFVDFSPNPQFPLHQLAYGGDFEAMETRLKELRKSAPASVCAPDLNGYTPLTCAALAGHVAIVRLLLSDGNAMAPTRDGYTALHMLAASCEASKKNNYDKVIRQLAAIAESLVPAPVTAPADSPLLVAVDAANMVAVRALLETRGSAWIDSKTVVLGWSAMHLAAKHGSVPLLRLLVQHGANPFVASECIGRPLDVAQCARNADAEQYPGRPRPRRRRHARRCRRRQVPRSARQCSRRRLPISPPSTPTVSLYCTICARRPPPPPCSGCSRSASCAPRSTSTRATRATGRRCTIARRAAIRSSCCSCSFTAPIRTSSPRASPRRSTFSPRARRARPTSPSASWRACSRCARCAAISMRATRAAKRRCSSRAAAATPTLSECCCSSPRSISASPTPPAPTPPCWRSAAARASSSRRSRRAASSIRARQRRRRLPSPTRRPTTHSMAMASMALSTRSPSAILVADTSHSPPLSPSPPMSPRIDAVHGAAPDCLLRLNDVCLSAVLMRMRARDLVVARRVCRRLASLATRAEVLQAVARRSGLPPVTTMSYMQREFGWIELATLARAGTAAPEATARRCRDPRRAARRAGRRAARACA
jgi:hypothetical protein